MICDRFFPRVRLSAASAAAFLAIALSAALAAPALAASPPDSFSMRISEKQGALLSNADSMMSSMSRDLGFDRMLYRNRPYVELMNDSTSKDPITEFHLDLGDPRFNFNCTALGACAMLGTSTPGIDLASSTSAGGNQLDLTIGNGGLLPGHAVRFRIALGFDTQYKTDKDYFATPDFRTVLFHMGGDDFYPDSMPSTGSGDAEVTVDFGALVAGPVSLSKFNQQIDPNAAKYYNNIYHAYGATDPVQVFDQLTGGTAVPEPCTAMLAGIGVLFGLLPLARRRRRD
jgi:hypothetical protein